MGENRRWSLLVRVLVPFVSLAGLGAPNMALTPPAAAQDAPLASDWTLGHKSRTRMTAARTMLSPTNSGAASSGHLYAFVEIALADGWKTYWKSPGDTGIPPRFDFAGSSNLASANVLYPAPRRIDEKGDIIAGYTGTVLFPVAITPLDPKAPVTLTALVQFGMCKEICVPTEAALTLSIPPDATGDLAAAEIESLGRVPRGLSAARPDDPRLGAVTTELTTANKKLKLTAEFPNGMETADVFLEAPDGLYLPLLTKTAESATSITFEADLSKDVDLEALKGKTIAVTLVSANGASEASFKFE